MLAQRGTGLKLDQRNINLYSKSNQTALEKFDLLTDELRLSRIGFLEFEISRHEYFSSHHSEVVR